ncbi:hypothetical protein FNW02_13885 [Komarekiella sp. 'clone 1']|jgi:hypothetical protein|uniref:Uncharacterized protein n=1 Tax=Komarekiella delphini-convector SJRDD-AB1 TaxID=2593771 RepID=A0AA40VR80_9NOST|nr:hypothetical protein [Komarekiella delphini-convector]MBD6616890.1 hypothetical protein [Komarekiella delphini-convector SJRDD-AB1]MBW4687368.1 hypothetical protein [Komarekiella atlantica HA4396-MV6]
MQRFFEKLGLENPCFPKALCRGATAVLGSHASRLNGGNLRTALAPQVEQVAWKPQVFDCLD